MMEHARYHPSIAKYTYVVEYREKKPSKKSYTNVQECADAGLQYGSSNFGKKLINVSVLENGKVIGSWRQ